jgi:hypothetical protein
MAANSQRSLLRYLDAYVIAAAYFVAAIIIYALWGLDIFPPCIFKLITGYSCPGCGLTRGLLAVLQLDFALAWHYNPLTFIVWPALLAYLIAHLRSKYKAHKCRKDIRPILIMILGTVFTLLC